MDEPIEQLTFEQSLVRLESVVRELESTEIGLDKSLERYEEGVRLLKRCRAILDAAERKVRLLTGLDAEGNPITEAFEAASSPDRPATENREPPDKSRRNTRRPPRGADENAANSRELF